MAERVTPAQRLSGFVSLPGDKSISHRYAMLGAISEGVTRIRNYSTGADCASTLECLRALGIAVKRDGSLVSISGCGLYGLREPGRVLDAGNSGSIMRMLPGILAAQRFPTRITGDESVRRRPVDRILRPLEAMGAAVSAREGRFPPLDIRPARLHPVDYEIPVPSAQVKTCILFAGLYADGVTTVRETARTRDHTELALKEFGAELDVEGRAILVRGPARLKARELSVPGDLSSAAFFMAAALLVPGSEISIEAVGLNPTRSALVDFLLGMGASIRVRGLEFRSGEAVGSLDVRHARLRGGVIEKGLTAALIDEIPVLAVLGAASEEGLTVLNAAELRIKETDRIATVAENLNRMGVKVEVQPDGFRVPGKQRFRAAALESFGDHRIAMAFAVAALAADGECAIEGAEAAAVSFPEFFDLLNGLRGH